jgi:THO complex subunit 4
MSGKLDQSLDEILSTRRGGPRRGTRNRVTSAAKAHTATAAPVGGVKKTTKSTKVATKGVPTGPAGASGESKIIVSGLVSF